MRADDTPIEPPRVHRPLPSIDIPLLREERKASRGRSVAGVIVLAAALGGGVTAVVLGPRLWGSSRTDRTRAESPVPVSQGASPMYAPDAARPLTVVVESPAPSTDVPGPPIAAPPTALPIPAPEPAASISRIVRPFGVATGFRDALKNAGCSETEALALIAGLERVIDFRRCHAEDQLAFSRDAEGTLIRFEYTAGPTQRYEATRTAGGTFRGRRVEVPIERTRVSRGGYVAGSLGDALDALGLGRSLVGVFVEVFEGQINFSTQTRAGDSFRILVDEERVGGQFLRYGTIHALEYTGERVGTKRAFFFSGEGEAGDFFDESGRAFHGGWLRTPLRYEHLSSPFNPRRRHPVLHRIMPHNGMDYAASTGTTVWAAADGDVTFAGEKGPNGNLVAIRHAGGFESFYAHLSRIQSGVRPGAHVRQRQPIGAVGSTGRSTGPHLHFGLKRHGRFVDPMRELNGPGRSLPRGVMNAYRQNVRRLRAELQRIPLAPAPSSAPNARPPSESMAGEEDF